MNKNKLTPKKARLGQFFTKEKIADKLVILTKKYINYKKTTTVLEPAFGKESFIKALKKHDFDNITGCEIDPKLTKTPKDFFTLPINNKFNLIIGNPPFSKYNVKESYFSPLKYISNPKTHPNKYLNQNLINKNKIRIENAFLLKSITHLSKNPSTLAFILPISFFIKNKNIETKKVLKNNFSSIIIYQDNRIWFDYHIPCCFAIFTNNKNLKNKILLIYENDEKLETKLDKNKILEEELIPKTYIYKKNNNRQGKELNNFLSNSKVRYKKSYQQNNISAKNIQNYKFIPKQGKTKDYKLAIVRVGNSSIGKAGLIDINEDTLNDMFYVFNFKDRYENKKRIKEKVCQYINYHQEYFKEISCRVGSKSLKKEDVLSFKMTF